MTAMELKYEKIPNESIDFDGHTLYQIRALRDFGNVRKGDVGGYIEDDYNLSHQGNCWVGLGAKVLERAIVDKDAVIESYSVARCKAQITDNAHVHGPNTEISGATKITGTTEIGKNVQLCDDHDYHNTFLSVRD